MALAAPMISIGILAHNEELQIAGTLHSLLNQSIFLKFDVELIVVANGCTDKTAEIANSILESASFKGSELLRVEVVEESGKANAWNLFVHKFSRPESTMLVLMDADITFIGYDCITSMISSLQLDRHALISIDKPIKNITLADRRTLFQSLLGGATPDLCKDNLPLCGQLYCIRAETARSITIPNEVVLEDGFLRAMVLTNLFTEPEDPKKIILAEGATHVFKSVATVTELLRHERWIVAGSVVNMLIFEKFASNVNREQTASSLMRDWGSENPSWLPDYIAQRTKGHYFGLLPRAWWTRRWTQLFSTESKELSLRRVVSVLLAFVMDTIVFVSAIYDVKQGRGFRYWRTRRLS